MRGINEPSEPRKAESPDAPQNPEVLEPATPEQMKRAKELLSHHGEHGNTCISCVGWRAFKSDPLPTNTSEPNVHKTTETVDKSQKMSTKLEPKSEIEAEIRATLQTKCYRPGCKVKHRAKFMDSVKGIQALIDKALIAELAGLKAQYKELYNLSLIHGGAYEDCLSDFAYQEISDVINRRLSELESGDKE